MTYEYSSESKRLDFPNPYRVENYFLLGAAVILLAGSVGLFMSGRGNIASNASTTALVPLLVGIFLFYRGCRYAIQALSQLRFLFGRDRPRGLAKQFTQAQIGNTAEADALKETVRQNALSLQESHGPLNGLLYSLVPGLIYAPMRIQRMAQRQFQTGLAMLATLLSLVVALIGVGDHRSASWLGLFYLAFSWFLLIKPITIPDSVREVRIGTGGLMILLLSAILGPVLIPMVAASWPVPPWLSINGQTTIPVLVAALGAVALFFAALMKQIVERPQTTMACEQIAITMNAHPKQILDEFEREMQKHWVESVPNRRYTKVVPEVILNQESGTFTGEMVEETQPMPRDDLRKLTFAECFSEPRFRWLAWLNVLGIVLMMVSVASLVFFARELNPHALQQTATIYATFGISILLVGRFCFAAGNFLWGRFDFVSDLTWVEMSGNYQAARLNYGNQFTDRVKTEKQVINIENMTLRVWMARLDTVCFGKESHRDVVGMRGLHQEAKRLHQHLANFATGQSIIISPTSNADLQKVAALGAINKLGEGDSRAALARGTTAENSGGSRCMNCGTQAESQARFCGNCGKGFVSGLPT